MKDNNFNTEILTGLVDTEQIKKAKKKLEKKKMSTFKKVIIIVSSILIFLLSSGLFLLYGPWAFFRETLITTAMTTLNHQYLATWFYDDETIRKVLEKNKIISTNEITDTSDILIKNYDKNIYQNYANKYEKAILKRTSEENLYKVIEIREATYKGFLVAVYDPSKVTIAHSKYLGQQGELITDIAKNNDAVVAINGGGFYDPDWKSQGGIPVGLTVKDGEIIYKFENNDRGNLIGLTEDNKLILGNMGISEIKKNKIRDAIQFGPFLIINGQKSKIYGNGGWGYGPRTVIGQRKDGIILMLVIDGRRATSIGASIKDVQDIMYNYGAYNAANLDGGSSTTLVVNNKVMNNPVAATPSGMRRIPNAFIVKK